MLSKNMDNKKITKQNFKDKKNYNVWDGKYSVFY